MSEPNIAARMLRSPQTQVKPGSLLLGDRIFDSNALHEAAAQRDNPPLEALSDLK